MAKQSTLTSASAPAPALVQEETKSSENTAAPAPVQEETKSSENTAAPAAKPSAVQLQAEAEAAAAAEAKAKAEARAEKEARAAAEEEARLLAEAQKREEQFQARPVISHDSYFRALGAVVGGLLAAGTPVNLAVNDGRVILANMMESSQLRTG